MSIQITSDVTNGTAVSSTIISTNTIQSTVAATGPVGAPGPAGAQGAPGTNGTNASSDHTLLSNIGTNTHTQIDTALTNLPETIRDTMGVALVAGTNVTITPNDGADTITIAATGGGGGATNLTNTLSPTNNTINSDTGTDAVIPATDATNAGLFIPAEKTKLTGIATSATANDTDVNLKARANHTGTQIASTISDFSTAADARIAAATATGTGSLVRATSPALVTPTGIVKNDVGLGNVDNTTDLNKPVSTAQAASIATKKTDSMATNKLLGRGTALTGVIEDITLGTNLSLTGTTLNAASGGSLPTQTGNARKMLTTDATNASWADQNPGLSTYTIAASDAPARDKAIADYVCDGVADDVEINAALTALTTAGGRVQLSRGTFAIAASINITGNGTTADSAKYTLVGAGPDTTSFNVATGVHGINITAVPKFDISNFSMNLLGASDGIRSTAGTLGDKRSFWQSDIHNVQFQGDNSTHSGWCMNLDNPFRSSFKNLQGFNVKNGIWLKSSNAAFNPGNLVFMDCHMDLGIANGTAYFLDTADAGGFFNICTFIECDAIDSNASSTTSIGWRFKGSTTTYFTTRDVLVLRSNIELFNKAVSIEHSANIEFHGNYIDTKTGGTIFDVSADSPNNILSVLYIYAPSPKTIKILNDLNTVLLQPTTLRDSFARVETGGTLTITKTAATVLSGLYRDSDGSGVYPTEWQAQTTPLVVKDEGTELFRGTRSLNFVGAGVTATNSTGDVTVTIPGGAGSGITRSINAITATVTGAAVASIDYVYYWTGAVAFTYTQPTAVGNTNMYTIKNTGTINQTIAFTGGQSADGSTTMSITPNTSISLISNNTNWILV